MRHESIFTDTEKMLDAMIKGEKAVVVKVKNKMFFYGEPSKREDDVRKLLAGAQVLYEGFETHIIEKR